VLKPVLQALVLADHVYKDVFTGKMVIAGAFNQVHFTKRAPERGTEQPAGQPRKLEWHEVARMGSPFAYISLTEIRGTLPIELRYVDLEDNVVMLRMELSVVSKSPLATAEIVVQLPPLPTPHAGVYALELLTENEPLGSLRITAIEGKGPSQEIGEERA
jgi:hypothetical protein